MQPVQFEMLSILQKHANKETLHSVTSEKAKCVKKESLKLFIAHLALKTRCFNLFSAGIIKKTSYYSRFNSSLSNFK